MQNLMAIGLIPEPMYKIDAHVHTTWEIIYYTQGTGVLKVGQDEIPFCPGDIVCQPPGIPHSESSESGFRNIHFIVGAFNNSNIAIPHFRDTVNGDFYNLLLQLYREFHLKRRNWENLTSTLLDALYQYMVSWNLENRKNPAVESLESLLISNISNTSFHLDKAMKEVPMSQDHLRKLFKKETGKNPLQYLIDLRIAYARQLLSSQNENRCTIKEIALRVGFEDPYYFSRTFKKVVGCAPSEWLSHNTEFR